MSHALVSARKLSRLRRSSAVARISVGHECRNSNTLPRGAQARKGLFCRGLTLIVKHVSLLYEFGKARGDADEQESIPFPRYPNGWFQVAYSDELAGGRRHAPRIFRQAPGALSRRRRPAPRARRLLPASRRAPRLRRQGGRQLHQVPFPRLEVRRHRPMRRGAVFAAHPAQGQGQVRLAPAGGEWPHPRLAPPAGQSAGMAHPGQRGIPERALDAVRAAALEDQDAQPGDGRKRGRLGALPLRARHRRDAEVERHRRGTHPQGQVGHRHDDADGQDHRVHRKPQSRLRLLAHPLPGHRRNACWSPARRPSTTTTSTFDSPSR